MADDKKAGPELDPVRTLVMAKMREHRMNMKELSQAIGRNDAYMQQYLKKRSPLVMPTGVAQLVGQILNIPVGLLVGDAQRQKLAASLRVLPELLRPVGDGAGGAGGQAIAGRSTASAEQLVPVYRCPGPMGDAFVTDWVELAGALCWCRCLLCGVGAGKLRPPQSRGSGICAAGPARCARGYCRFAGRGADRGNWRAPRHRRR